MTVIPAYGHDYKSKEEVQKAWDDNKDFLICSGPDDGRYINKEDVKEPMTIMVRYARLRKIMEIKV